MAMSKQHKKALAEGRRQSAAVKAYLTYVQNGRDSGPDPDKLQQRIAERAEQIASTDDPVARLELIQKRLDDEAALAQVHDSGDPEELEAAFIDVAQAFSERRGISYTAWREIGVPAATLRAAGIPRTRRPSAA